MDTGLNGQDGGTGRGARFQQLVGVCSILERKALIDVNAHLSRSHHLEQLVRGSFERIASLYAVEEEWARQKERFLLRQQNGRNGRPAAAWRRRTEFNPGSPTWTADQFRTSGPPVCRIWIA